MNRDTKGEWQGLDRERKHTERKKKINLTKKRIKRNQVVR